MFGSFSDNTTWYYNGFSFPGSPQVAKKHLSGMISGRYRSNALVIGGLPSLNAVEINSVLGGTTITVGPTEGRLY